MRHMWQVVDNTMFMDKIRLEGGRVLFIISQKKRIEQVIEKKSSALCKRRGFLKILVLFNTYLLE